MRLAGERRHRFPGRGNGSDDGPATGLEAVRRRKSRVGVRTDQSGPGVDGRRSHPQPGIVEASIQTDDHRVEVGRRGTGSVVAHRNGTAPLHRFVDTWPSRDEDPLPRLDEMGRCDSGTDHVACSRDADTFERSDVFLDPSHRVVGDEDDSPTRRPKARDGVGRARNRLVGQPHHPVEITEHRSDGIPAVFDHLCIVALVAARHWHAGGVPRFTPFPALRYRDRNIDDLIAPPYDVLSDADVDALNARSPHNITHVDVPREAAGADRYTVAGDLLRRWVADGVLVADDVPSFTIYRMRFTDATGTDRDIAGVLGGLEVVDEGAGGVLPHERVTPKASTDRLDLTRATQANMSPIWGLSLADGLTELLAEPGEHLSSVTVDGVEHVVERVDDADRVAAIAAKVGSDDVLIADGHHRYGISRTFRDEVRGAGASDTPAEDTLAFVSELVADQLSVEAIHRLYTDIDADALRDALSTAFDLSDAGTPSAATLAEMDDDGKLCLVKADGTGEWLTPKPGAFDDVRALDGAWLEHVLADVAHTVSYQHGVSNVVDAVTSGAATAAVLIRPVSVAEIERTAREGLLMPPKSTFFTPKLRTGLVVRTVG